MQFYPLGLTSFATRVTSASISNVATFLTIPVVPTASFGLNFIGPSGSIGASYTRTGATGPEGPQGPAGPKGLGVYLLSSARVTCSYAFNFGYAALEEPRSSACIAIPSTYYSTAASFTTGDTLYTTERRTTTVVNGYYSDGTTVWQTTSGVADAGTSCIGGGGGGGGGGCSSTCEDGVGCSAGCVCSTNVGVGFCQEEQPI